MTNMKTAMVWSRVSPSIEKIMRELATAQGLTLSEYMRQLIVKDLDTRSVFTTQLKDALFNNSEVPRNG